MSPAPRRFLALAVLAASPGAVLLPACSDDAGDAAPEYHLVAFHAEQQPFEGFGQDTGLQPDGSPVQVRFVVGAAGGLTVDAQAATDGEAASGVAGSGALALTGSLTAQTSLKVDVGPFQFDGPLSGMPDIVIQFDEAQPFDPFLVGGKATVTAEIPETEVAVVPLRAAAGIPGTLHVLASGTVTSDFAGVCAGVAAGGVTDLGATVTTGSLVLSALVDIEIPITGPEPFGPFVLPAVPIGPFEGTMDFGTQAGGALAPAGTGSAAVPNACVDAPVGDGGGSGTEVGPDPGDAGPGDGTVAGDGTLTGDGTAAGDARPPTGDGAGPRGGCLRAGRRRPPAARLRRAAAAAGSGPHRRGL